MNTRCVFAPEADADLELIGDCMARDSPARALRFIEKLPAQARHLAEMPGMGRARAEFATPNLHSLTHGGYVIFYRPASYGVEVLRVLHGRRNLAELL